MTSPQNPWPPQGPNPQQFQPQPGYPAAAARSEAARARHLLAFVTPVLFTLLVFLKPSNDYIKLMAGR